MTKARVSDGEPRCPRDEDQTMSLFDPEDSIEDLDEDADDADEEEYEPEREPGDDVADEE